MAAIEIRDLYKSFRIYSDRGQSLKEVLLSPERRRYQTRSVLEGISLTVAQGEAVALIGRNGSGKSTLLKLMSRILYPERGSVQLHGRVSSLIELGAGFHPDMTGRENIYTNASIFGLTRAEIDARLGEIIAFSELADFIDDPVRTYSSGMYMRLAFSVAIHVGADILLIDEILAVGDAAFQAKCFARLMELKAAGTTIVIVSHSMAQLERICDRTVWLEGGTLRMEGKPDEVHPCYLAEMGRRQPPEIPPQPLHEVPADSPAKWQEIVLLDAQGARTDRFCTGDTVTLRLRYTADPVQAEEAMIGLAIYRADHTLCYGTNTQREHLAPVRLQAQGEIRCTFSPMNLIAGSYWIDVGLRRPDLFAYDYAAKAVRFTVSDPIDETGIARLAHTWEIQP